MSVPESGASDGGPIVRADKTCRVCGDCAIGFNFAAVTCESCKAFFRRNALAPKRPRCARDGCCVMSRTTRRQCKACRLEKCFAVGMQKDSIMCDHVLRAKRTQYRKTPRHASRRPVVDTQTAVIECVVASAANHSPETPSTSTSTTMVLAKSQLCACQCACPKYSGQSVHLIVREACDRQRVGRRLAWPREPLTPIPTAAAREVEWSVENGDRARIDNLAHAWATAILPVEDNQKFYTPPPGMKLAHFLIVQMVDHTSRSMINLARNTSSFHSLDFDDQGALVIGNIFHLIITYGIHWWDHERRSWRVNGRNNALHFTITDFGTISQSLAIAQEKFLSSIDPVWMRDVTAIQLMCMVVLFNDDVPRLKHRQVARDTKALYAAMLRRCAHKIPRLTD